MLSVARFSTHATAGGCGNSGCACAAAAAAASTPTSSSASAAAAAKTPTDSQSARAGGCGSASCACAAAAKANDNLAELESQLSALQSSVRELHAAGRYADALQAAEESSDLALNLFGAKHPVYASTLTNRALFHRIHEQDYAKAAQLGEQAREIYKAALGEQHQSYITCLTNLGAAYRSLGDLPRAHSTLSSLIISLESSIPVAQQKSSLPLAQAELHLAGVLLARQDGAARDVERAIALLEGATKRLLRKFGEEHPQVATAINNLALAFKLSGDRDRALVLYERALGIRSRNLPPMHPDLLVSMHNLAELLHQMGREEEAQGVQQKILAMMQADEAGRQELEAAQKENEKNEKASASAGQQQS